MRSFDPSRFIFSLAGALMGEEWTAGVMKAGLPRSAGDYSFRSPRLIEAILSAFPARPEYQALVRFLQSDAGVVRALNRAARATPRVSKARSLRLPMMEPPPRWLGEVVLPNLATEKATADWLEIDPRRLEWLADVSGRNRKHAAGPLRTYRYRWIPRRNGLPRLLEIPKAELKLLQRKILAEILNAIPVHPAAHGFRAGRSIVTNAAAHCGKEAVLRFDLEDFFPSVTSARIFQIFRTIGYPVHVARLLMGLCTTSVPADIWDARPGARDGADFFARQRLITRHLPQGAPTSPALANLAAARLDRRLHGLASDIGATYTRYADDLTFSGGDEVARSRKRLGTIVAVAAHEEGFALNHRKTRIMRPGIRQHVTGVVVNVRPNLARREFDRLKAILTNAVRHGPASQNRENVADFRAHLAGKVAHVSSIHREHGAKLLSIFGKIVWHGAS